MSMRINERVKVGVVFGNEGQKIAPKWFFWRGRHMKITETTYVWHEREGRDMIYKFMVTDGNDLYELSYSRETLLWFLEAVETGG